MHSCIPTRVTRPCNMVFGCHWGFSNHATTKRVFGSVVAVAFKITFRAEMHVNDVFLFFKNHF